jgi:hypothetical protein
MFLHLHCEKPVRKPEAYIKTVIESTLKPLANKFDMILILDDT